MPLTHAQELDRRVAMLAAKILRDVQTEPERRAIIQMLADTYLNRNV